MISIENFEKEYEELILLHKYIDKKYKKNLVLFVILEIILWSTTVFFASLERPVVIFFGLLSYASLLLIPLLFGIRKKFVKSNFINSVISYINENTEYQVVKKENSKEIRNSLVTTSNMINKNFSTSFLFAFDVYEKKEPIKPLLSYYYGTFGYGKNISYSGSVIVFNNEQIKCDYKIFSKNLEMLSIDYSKDKELSDNDGHRYYYNKKNTTILDKKLQQIVSILHNFLNGDINNDCHPCGVSSKDGKITLMIPSFKKRYSFDYIKVLNKESFELYLNNMLDIFELVTKINKEIGE